MATDKFFCNNMNTKDRVGRGILGVILVAASPAGFNYLGYGVAGWFSLLFGIANVIASAMGWCFMYSLVGLNSRKTQPDDASQADWKPLNFQLLRKRTITGFLLITTTVTGLLIAEVYLAAHDAISEMEIEEASPYLDIISQQLSNQTTDEPTEAVVRNALGSAVSQFQSPLLAIATYDSKVISASHRLDQTIVSRLLENHRDKTETHASLTIPSDSPDLVPSTDVTEHRFSSVGSQEYVWSHRRLTVGSQGINLSVVKPAHSTTAVSKMLFDRLLASSMMVVWISIWAAIIVAYFMWRRIERSNHYAYQASITDQETGLHNQRWLGLKMAKLNTSQKSYLVSAVSFRNLSKIAAASGFGEASLLMEKFGARLNAEIGGQCTVARLNSGAIVVIAPDSSAGLLERFTALINEHQLVGDNNYTLAPTEVRLRYPEDVASFDDMLTAISALIVDANKKRINVAYYDDSVMRSRLKETQYASEISAALEFRQFEIYLQPKVDLQSGLVRGAEGLVRWNHPEDGLLAPGMFLDTIERSNYRAEFAMFVAEETMRLCQQVHALGHKIEFSFNLSGFDVVDPTVRSKLKELGSMFSGHTCRPEIELTEAETSIDVNEIWESLNELSELGYRIALDDFGTGMSSLSYCHKLPINTIKIDKSFLDVLLEDALGVVPIASILSLAECYGYDVVVEGVETSDQAAILANMGCTLCQGYYFAKPLRLSDFIDLLERQPLHTDASEPPTSHSVNAQATPVV